MKRLALALALTPLAAAAATPSYQGLWWKDPPGSESGWGVNLTHQGDILFATWFTYDAQGSPLWLVMPAGERVEEADGYDYGYGYGATMPDPAYSGTLYRASGPAFDAATFDPGRVVLSVVGEATFRFSAENRGMFSYTVNGVAGAKAITRQVFGPLPACELGGAPGSSPNYQDLWWRSPAGSESGWGVNVAHQGDTLFATWFTYGADGRGTWFVMSNGARTGPSTYAGTLYRTTGPAFDASPWNPAAVTATAVGAATFSFADAANGTFAFTVEGFSQSKPITRQVYSTPSTVCR